MSRIFCAAIILCAPSLVWAQETGDELQQETKLDELVVTATPLEQTIEESAQPVAVLESTELELQSSATLGETLSAQPGIASTSFGAGASRPVIRGLGGDRIRVLQNGLGTLDISNTSPDHAVALEPILADKVEVVRGPATLLFGTSAIGGVVNSLDNRVPTGLPEGPASGALEFRTGSVNEERATAGRIEAPLGRFALHLDGAMRETHSYRIPGFARTAELRDSETIEYDEARGRLSFSDTDTEAWGVGGSFILEQGYAGLAGSGYNTRYGVPNGEEDVSIELQQRRIESRTHIHHPSPELRHLDFKIAYVNYEHTEFEGEEIGTVFENKGIDARFEIAHEQISGFEGLLGMQLQTSDFSAEGAEAFIPPSNSEAVSLFLFERTPLRSDRLEFQFGGRIDYTSLSSERFIPYGSDEAGSIGRTFPTFGTSAGLVWDMVEGYTSALSVSYSQRAPSSQELFANGVHVATAAFEVGDPGLDREHSVGVDLSVRKTAGRVTGSLSTFINRYFSFIGLVPTGVDLLSDEHVESEDHAHEEEHGEGGHGDEDSGHHHDSSEFPLYAFVDQEVHFFGFESEIAYHLLGEVIEGEEPSEDLVVILQPDWVWAEDLHAGDSVPRLPPFRLRGALQYALPDLLARVEVQQVFRQDRNAMFESETGGYTMVNLYLSKQIPSVEGLPMEIFLRGTNLLNEKARNSVSFIKDVAPLPGANVVAGIRVSF